MGINDYLIMGGQLLLSLTLLVVLHEAGHFFAARFFKTRVEKFYVFMNPWFSLFKKKIGDTEFGIGWLPIGGYVKISGMIDESMDKEQLNKDPESWEFRAKPTWQRLIIILAGVIVNLLVAMIIYAFVLFIWGEEIMPNESLKHGFSVTKDFEELGFCDKDRILKIDGENILDARDVNKTLLLDNVQTITVLHSDNTTQIINIPKNIGYELFEKENFTPLEINFILNKIDSVVPGSIADKSGLIKDDKILKINNDNINLKSDLNNALELNSNKDVTISILRGNDTIVQKSKLDDKAKLGILLLPNEKDFYTQKVKYGFFESIPKGISNGYNTLKMYIKQFKFVFTSKGVKSLGGFGSMAKIYGTSWDWQRFWVRTAFISVALAFMNVLPIPALDGGHALFIIYEMITGRTPNEKLLEYAQIAGMILLVGLMLYANGNDIFGWFK